MDKLDPYQLAKVALSLPDRAFLTFVDRLSPNLRKQLLTQPKVRDRYDELQDLIAYLDRVHRLFTPRQLQILEEIREQDPAFWSFLQSLSDSDSYLWYEIDHLPLDAVIVFWPPVGSKVGQPKISAVVELGDQIRYDYLRMESGRLVEMASDSAVPKRFFDLKASGISEGQYSITIYLDRGQLDLLYDDMFLRWNAEGNLTGPE